MNQIAWVMKYMIGKRWMFFIGIGMAVLSAILFILYPMLSQILVDEVLIGTENASGEIIHAMEKLPILLILITLAQLLRSLNQYGMIVIMDKVSQEFIQKLRLDLYEKISKQGSSFYAKFHTGDLMTRLTSDVDMIRHFIAWMSYSMVQSFSMFVLSMVYFFTINVKLTMALLVISPCVLGASYFYCNTVRPFYEDLREQLANMNNVAQENITANKLVRAFSREKYENEKFDIWNKGYRDANLRSNKQWVKFYPLIEGFSQGMVVIILILGGYLIIQGEMTLGELAAFSLLSWGVSVPMRELGMYLNELQNFHVSARKVIEIYEEESKIVSPMNGYQLEGALTGDIVYKGVKFKYDDEPVKHAIRGIDWTIQAGSTVGIMGVTGSGKSTLVNMLVRLIDVTEGSLTVNGVDVKEWDLQNLRSHIGVATQEVLLYSDTVDANIAYGKPNLNRTDVKGFAQLAAAQFIDRLSMGMETVIGERGTGLSGGQKQRIALARALAIEPSILVLDDTTSAVDIKTEQYIQESLKQLPFECTKIMIAQRISSVQNADQIMIMHEGQMIQCGTHKDLVKQDGYYRNICKLQGVEVNG